MSQDPLTQKEQLKEAAYRRLSDNEDFLNYIVAPAKQEASACLNEAVLLATGKKKTSQSEALPDKVIKLICEYHTKETFASQVHDYLESRTKHRQKQEADKIKSKSP